MHPLDGVRLKISRAEEHLNALKREFVGFFDLYPYGIAGKFDTKTSRYHFYVRVLQHPPRAWGLVIGDFVHNASSALDQLAWELVRLNGKVPIDGVTGFPILEKECYWPGKGVSATEGMHERHIAAVKRLQPYHRGDEAPWMPLAWLRRLSNIDKHRVLHTTFGRLRSAGIDNFVMLRDVERVTPNFELFLPRMEDGAEIAWVEIVPSGADPKVHMELVQSADIAFRNPPGLLGPSIEGHPVEETLTKILREVFNVYTEFAYDFG